MTDLTALKAEVELFNSQFYKISEVEDMLHTNLAHTKLLQGVPTNDNNNS